MFINRVIILLVLPISYIVGNYSNNRNGELHELAPAIDTCKTDTLVKGYSSEKSIFCLIKVCMIGERAYKEEICYFDSLYSSKKYYEIKEVDGERQGVQVYYWPNGNLRRTENYCRDRPLGGFQEFWENGNYKRIGYYKYISNSCDLPLIVVRDSGIDSLYYGLNVTYSSVYGYYRALDGQWLDFDTLGKIHQISNFDNGLRIGKWYYYSDLNLIKMEEYENDSIVKKILFNE
jgi:hypothetical protein